MNSKNFSEAMNKLEDKYITEAITYNHMSKTGTRRHIKKGFLIAALIAALLLLCAAAYAAIIRSSQRPSKTQPYIGIQMLA